MITPEEMARYDRQMMIRGFGTAGQEKLKKARILIAGCGGLGSASALYLVAAGIGTIRLVDNDRVEPGNLNRQILHWNGDIGRGKVASAAEKLGQLNLGAEIEPVNEKITEDNVSRLLEGCDLVVDALDNLETRYVLNRAALRHKIPFFYGAVYGFEGRAMTVLPGETACLKCIYRGSIPEENVPVVGVTPAVIGCIQATEVIKYLVGVGSLLTNRLLVYDGLKMKSMEFKVRRDPSCEHCGSPLQEGAT